MLQTAPPLCFIRPLQELQSITEILQQLTACPYQMQQVFPVSFLTWCIHLETPAAFAIGNKPCDMWWKAMVTVRQSLVMQARIASQAVCVGDYIWLIGGWDPGMNKDGGEILSDIWRLDTKSWTWSQAHTEVGHLVKQLDCTCCTLHRLKAQFALSACSGCAPCCRCLGHSCYVVCNK